MGSLVNHNSTHDLYNYPPIQGNYIDSSNYANNISSFPISYNTSCWIKDPIYNLPNIDFSGISIRTRGAPTYGFDDLSSRPDMDPSGLIKGWTGGTGINGQIIHDIFAGTTNVFPTTAFRFFRDYSTFGGTGAFDPYNRNYPHGRLGYYYPGRPLGNKDIAEDWQNWNCGYPCGVLISPRHVVVTGHFVGYGGNATFYFLGKNNVIYGKAATQVYRSTVAFDPRPPLQPPGYDLGNGPDIAIYQLNEKFTEEELQQVKVYKMFDLGSISNSVGGNFSNLTANIPVFTLWNQGFVTVSKAGSDYPYFNLDDHPNAAHVGGRKYWEGISGMFAPTYFPNIFSPNYGATFSQPDGRPITPNNPLIPIRGRLFLSNSHFWIGDSGTPELIHVPSINETCFIQLRFGAGGYRGSKWSPQNSWLRNLEKFWNNVKNYVYENTDPPYTMQFIEYADIVRPRVPYKNFITIEGITYYAQFEYDSLPGTLGTGERSLSAFVTPGTTYSFAVIAVSKSGEALSEPVTLRDVYFPRGATAQFPSLIP